MSAKTIDERLRLKGDLKKSRVMVYLPVDAHKSLKRVCADKGFSVNEVIIELVNEYLADSSAKPAKDKK